MKKNALIVGCFILAILIIDQCFKIYVKTNFSAHESVSIFGDWFIMQYTENPGMAFGTTFGSKVWHKLALSIFRIIAIVAIVVYWIRQVKKGARTEFLIVIGLIFAGATGNLIDSIFYDFAFENNMCLPFNYMEGSGNFVDCGYGQEEVRHQGFLLGNVVDMFKFEVFWPKWVPWLGGTEVFPAIWNVADASISIGIVMVLLRQRKYFPKK